MLCTITQSWGWTGLNPKAIFAFNDFGNLIVISEDDAYWRICPEELLCTAIAANPAEFNALWSDQKFQQDWQMERLVEIAASLEGRLSEDRCYCLKLLAALGGKYEGKNIGTVSRRELIAFAGNIARQIHLAPDGTPVKIKLIAD